MSAEPKRRVFFVGCGNMGGAILASLDRSKWEPIVCDVDDARREEIKAMYNVQVEKNVNAPSITTADVIILAVKPQVIGDVFSTLEGVTLKDQLVLSVITGVRLESLRKGLKGQNLSFVRLMPNTPVKISKGTTGVFAEDPKRAHGPVEELLGGISTLHFVEKEDLIDVVAAVSGSGPAYLFAFLNGMVKAGEALGLSHEVAASLVLDTALGSALLAASDSPLASPSMAKVHPPTLAELRDMVATKGGSTERALKVFNERELEQTTLDAIKAALARNKEIAALYSTK